MSIWQRKKLKLRVAKHRSQIPHGFSLKRRLKLRLPGPRAYPLHHYPVPSVLLYGLLWNRECLPLLCEHNRNFIFIYGWLHLPETLGECRKLHCVDLSNTEIHPHTHPLKHLQATTIHTCYETQPSGVITFSLILDHLPSTTSQKLMSCSPSNTIHMLKP